MTNEHYDWLLDARAKNQRELLRLLTAGQRYKAELTSHAVERTAYLLLVGTAFSLWRAAFLTDEARAWDGIVGDSLKLLETLVRDNAIGYPQDRATKEWTSGFYLNGAWFRLVRAVTVLEDASPLIREYPAVAALCILDERGLATRVSREVWSILHDALTVIASDFFKRADGMWPK